MSMLILGLLIWSGAHLFKAAAPGQRADIAGSVGATPARILFAVLIAAGLLAMIFGYRAAPLVPVWTPPAWTVHLNNLLMLGAVAVYGMSMSKGRTRAWFRHPQLTAVVIWAVAHLLVNGDVASLILFGGLGAWAFAEMAAINARDGAWVRPEPGPAKRDLVLVAITLVLFGLITAIHAWLGYWPFPR
jgi:uncharacterized membrane protein